jgi:hypothetical protein
MYPQEYRLCKRQQPGLFKTGGSHPLIILKHPRYLILDKGASKTLSDQHTAGLPHVRPRCVHDIITRGHTFINYPG